MFERNKLSKFSGSAAKYAYEDDQELKMLLGYKTILLQRTLWEHGIRVKSWLDKNERKIWAAYGLGKSIRFAETMPIYTLLGARKITNDKHQTKEYLDSFGIKTPKGQKFNVTDKKAMLKWFDSLDRKKIVLKPTTGSFGKGITTGIETPEQLINALTLISTKECLLEEHIDNDGCDYRLLVIGGMLIAATRRTPAHVVGDGKLSIKELIAKKNAVREKIPYIKSHLIEVDETTIDLLKERGLSLESVIEDGKVLRLKRVANVGAGGEGEEILEKVHPTFAKIAQKCWEAFPSMTHCGVDIVAEDISKSPDEQSWAVIEINANCDLTLHHFPIKGTARDVSSALVRYLFPKAKRESHSVKLLINGKVTNVGFRKFLLKQAVLKGVNGYCKNVDETTVEAVFQGSNAAVEELISLASQGTPNSIVRTIDYRPYKGKTHTRFTSL